MGDVRKKGREAKKELSVLDAPSESKSENAGTKKETGMGRKRTYK